MKMLIIFLSIRHAGQNAMFTMQSEVGGRFTAFHMFMWQYIKILHYTETF